MNPIKAYRAERVFRYRAQRLVDCYAANAADDGDLPFDARGARLVHRTPFWRAVLARTLRRTRVDS